MTTAEIHDTLIDRANTLANLSAAFAADHVETGSESDRRLANRYEQQVMGIAKALEALGIAGDAGTLTSQLLAKARRKAGLDPATGLFAA